MNDPTKETPKKIFSNSASNDYKTGLRRLAQYSMKGGRGLITFFGAAATGYYLNSVAMEHWEAYQKHKFLMTPEIDARLRERYPTSTEYERRKIALADDHAVRVRAQVQGQIAERQALQEPLPKHLLEEATLSKPKNLDK